MCSGRGPCVIGVPDVDGPVPNSLAVAVGWCVALVAQAESPALLSDPVRLSELFRPQTFLNAVRQQTARHTGASMDSLKVPAAHLQCFPHALDVGLRVQALSACPRKPVVEAARVTSLSR